MDLEGEDETSLKDYEESESYLHQNIIEEQALRSIWEEIDDDFEKKRLEIEKYKESKTQICEAPPNPVIKFLDDKVFNLLLPILDNTISKAMETNSLKYQKSPFNGVDFISEMLWNLNPVYPERQLDWTYIHDMDWVKKHLEENPRPYFPFSWIWSKDYAATKIQAYLRGYWTRRRPDVQEIRQFWKDFYVNGGSFHIQSDTKTSLTIE